MSQIQVGDQQFGPEQHIEQVDDMY